MTGMRPTAAFACFDVVCIVFPKESATMAELAVVAAFLTVIALDSSLVGLGLLLGRVGAGYLRDRIFAPRLAARSNAAKSGYVLVPAHSSAIPGFFSAMVGAIALLSRLGPYRYRPL